MSAAVNDSSNSSRVIGRAGVAVGDSEGDGEDAGADVLGVAVGEPVGRLGGAAGDCAFAMDETIAPAITSAGNRFRMVRAKS